MGTVTRMELRKISELHPYEHNAKLHPPEQIEALRRSFREFGMIVPVGVAVLNLKQLRADNATEFMVRELNRFAYRFLDQDVMNRFAVPDKTVDLPVRYNECFCCGQTDDPAIVHYAGYPDWYCNPDTPRYEYRAKYLDGGAK